MKIEMTFREIKDSGVWDEFCEMRGYNPWMLAEGTALSSDIELLTFDEAVELGLVKEYRE